VYTDQVKIRERQMIGKKVRAKAPPSMNGESLRTVQGLVVGEDGDCWVLQKVNGYRERWNKVHCEVIEHEEQSKKARKIIDAIRTNGPRIYGDGDC